MELAIEIPVVRRAEAAGWFVRKVQWVGRVGAPDRVFAKEQRIVWIEFKDTGQKPRLSQLQEHKRMREAGMEVHVCDTVSSALRVLGIIE